MVGCRAYRQSSSGSSVCLRKATTTASSSTDRAVDLGFLGPVGRSETDDRAFHLAMVFGLTPWRLASPQALLMVWTALAPILPMKRRGRLALSNIFNGAPQMGKAKV